MHEVGVFRKWISCCFIEIYMFAVNSLSFIMLSYCFLSLSYCVYGYSDRDLKPGNILISKDCKLRITDFGLARYMDEKTLSGNSFTKLLNAVRTYCLTAESLLLMSYFHF